MSTESARGEMGLFQIDVAQPSDISCGWPSRFQSYNEQPNRKCLFLCSAISTAMLSVVKVGSAVICQEMQAGWSGDKVSGVHATRFPPSHPHVGLTPSVAAA